MSFFGPFHGEFVAGENIVEWMYLLTDQTEDVVVRKYFVVAVVTPNAERSAFTAVYTNSRVVGSIPKVDLYPIDIASTRSGDDDSLSEVDSTSD